LTVVVTFATSATGTISTRRLDEREIAVRENALGHPHRGTKVNAIVVLGDPRQVTGPAERVQPDGERGDRHQHDDAARP
jgi:hypothetical protein